MKRIRKILASTLGLFLIAAPWAAQADLSMPAGFECDIFVQDNDNSPPDSETQSGQYNKKLDPKNLTEMMKEFHRLLKRHYPPDFDDSGNNKVKCDYRDADGKGNYTVYFYVDSSGNPYGPYIP